MLVHRLLSRLPLSRHTRPLHAITYLLAVPLFSISFLVFLNSSLSFLLTTLFNIPASRLGSIVGTLGFVDELVAIVAAPLWGLISDGRLGTRGVSALGYAAIAISLVLFVELRSVYPGLVIGRIVFSLGGAAVTCMVSAILPEMTSPVRDSKDRAESGETETEPELDEETQHPTGKLAGLVGLFTGLGALLALGVFLPLPTRFAARPDVDPAQAVRSSYFIVATIAAVVAVWCVLGLPPPRNTSRTSTWQDIKTWIWVRIWGGDPAVYASDDDEQDTAAAAAADSTSTPRGIAGLWAAATVAVADGRIGVAYVGGFVARASSVGISLFIPLFVNHYFVSTGRCEPTIPELTKDECRRAYVLASTLTGTSQLTALVLAPVFGWMTDRCAAVPHLRNVPLILSAALGILGFTLFSVLPTPATPAAFFYAALTGASQIGAIVASLGLLSQGIVDVTRTVNNGNNGNNGNNALQHSPPSQAPAKESEPLLSSRDGGNSNGQTKGRDDSTKGRDDSTKGRDGSTKGREGFKGSIAGAYSLSGAAAILVLTKGGGAAFDKNPGAPFWLLAGFNVLLGLVAVGNLVWVLRKRRQW